MLLSYNRISKLHVFLHIFEKYHSKDLLEKQMCNTKLLWNKEKYCTKFTEDLKVNTFPAPNQVAPLFLTERECQFAQNHNKRQHTWTQLIFQMLILLLDSKYQCR